jgi:preprotein translocase subunit SecE
VNRETKRMMQRQGQMEADGSPTARKPPPSTRAQGAPTNRKKRTSPAQFFREVREELRQVAWPTREEMVNYVAVVFSTLVFMILLIFLLNWGFSKGVVFLFTK